MNAPILQLLLALMLLAPVPALASDESDLVLTVTPELSGGAQPYSREMLLLRLKGVYRTTILREKLFQPPLTNFSWTQLGRDNWHRIQMEDGQTSLIFERMIAIFPQHTGSFEIEPFTHELTVDHNGERQVIAVRSKPLTVAVDTWKPKTGGPDAPEPWWLPARDVTVTDKWEPDPETVKIGESTRRTVTLEAQGMLAEGMPPRPILRTRGILTFNGPVSRETIITPGGPVARATYQWEIRPGVPEVIPLDAIKIPWFDTATRTMREAEIPARQIGGGLADQQADLAPPKPATWWMIGLASVSAFGFGLALIGFGTGPGTVRIEGGDRRALRRAAQAGDARAFRAVLGRAAQAEPELAARWRNDAVAAEGFAALDRHVFGDDGDAMPDLTALLRVFTRPRRLIAEVLAPSSKLAPLDGAS